MNIKTSKRQKNNRTLNETLVTNPLGRGELKKYVAHQNIRLTLDKIAFGALGALAIYAFYAALASLML